MTVAVCARYMEDMQQMNSGKTYALDSFATLVKVILLLNLVLDRVVEHIPYSLVDDWSYDQP